MTNKPKGRKRGPKPRGSSPKDQIQDGACSPWPAPLSIRHSKFLDFYMVSFNGSEAARQCGYSKRSAHDTAHAILNRPDVRLHLQLRRLEHSERLGGISKERWERELEAVALANMRNYIPLLGDGAPADKVSALTVDQAAALASITVEEFRDGRTNARHVRRTKFTLVPKAKGLELLGQARGWIVEKVDHKHKHEHQHLILGVMLKEIAATEDGKPIVDGQALVEGPAPIVEPEEAA